MNVTTIKCFWCDKDYAKGILTQGATSTDFEKSTIINFDP